MDVNDETLSALGAVAETAKERSGDHPGFNCVLMFIERDELLEFMPSYPGSILQESSEFMKDYFAYLKSNDLTIKFIGKVLSVAAERGPSDAKELARRIINQMEMDNATRWSCRRPTMYVVGRGNGVAIALAIDDRFWTDAW